MKRLVFLLPLFLVGAFGASAWADAKIVRLINPVSGQIVKGTVTIRWTYGGFGPATPVAVEVAPDASGFRVVAITPIGAGSAIWETMSLPDTATYVVRIRVLSEPGGTAATGVTVDNTSPEITFVNRTPLPNEAGWNRADVQVNWSCDDALSGPSAPTSSQTVSTDGSDLTATGSCTDRAGNEARHTVTGIKIDKVNPSITFDSLTPAANEAGWNRTGVTVTWSCADELSGPSSPTDTKTITAQGADQPTTGTCTDVAGNSASDTQAVSIDTTAPEMGPVVRTPAANTNGWNNTDVTLSWTCTDGLSGAGPGQVVISDDGAGQSATASCADTAGNASPEVVVTNINIDKTAPEITYATRTAPNGAGWNNTDVTVTWNCADALSGPTSPTVSTPVTAEGENQSATGTCTDLAGNSSANDTQVGIDIDKAAPVPSGTADPAANAAGWHNAPFTVTWSGTDSLSGVASCSASEQYSGPDSGAGALQGVCTDKAGNASAPQSFPFRYDATAPTIAYASRAPAANGYGWNRSDVTLTWNCGDATSGPVADPISVIVTTEGENQSVTGTCTDAAGNAASDTQSGVNLDRTAPATTIAGPPVLLRNPSAGLNGIVRDEVSKPDDANPDATLVVIRDSTGAIKKDAAGKEQRPAFYQACSPEGSVCLWTVGARDLPVGMYTATTWSVDRAGNLEIPGAPFAFEVR